MKNDTYIYHSLVRIFCKWFSLFLSEGSHKSRKSPSEPYTNLWRHEYVLKWNSKYPKLIQLISKLASSGCCQAGFLSGANKKIKNTVFSKDIQWQWNEVIKLRKCQSSVTEALVSYTALSFLPESLLKNVSSENYKQLYNWMPLKQSISPRPTKLDLSIHESFIQLLF